MFSLEKQFTTSFYEYAAQKRGDGSGEAQVIESSSLEDRTVPQNSGMPADSFPST